MAFYVMANHPMFVARYTLPFSLSLCTVEDSVFAKTCVPPDPGIGYGAGQALMLQLLVPDRVKIRNIWHITCAAINVIPLTVHIPPHVACAMAITFTHIPPCNYQSALEF